MLHVSYGSFKSNRLILNFISIFYLHTKWLYTSKPFWLPSSLWFTVIVVFHCYFLSFHFCLVYHFLVALGLKLVPMLHWFSLLRLSAPLESLIREKLSAKQPEAYEWFWSEQVPSVVTSFVKKLEADGRFTDAVALYVSS